MTDIVERLRLRRDPLTDGERAEAADEIERLRQQVEALKVYTRHAHERDGAEIERLREECLTRHADQRAKAEEIERLRSVANRGGHLAVANAEIERLREVLRHVVDNPWDYDSKRVREALGDEGK
jgi:hypothetical protein